MTKRALLIIMVMICACTAAHAQKSELSLSYGGYTQMDASNCHDGWKHVNSAWGALSLGLNFNIAPRLQVGPSYTFSSTTTKGANHSSIAYHALMVNARYTYYTRARFNLYGHLGIGTIISHFMPYDDDTYNKAYFAMQLVPLGIDVPINSSFKFFSELGYGPQGLIQIGFRLGL